MRLPARTGHLPRHEDVATLTEHWIRHGDWLTVVTIVTDPVYLAEHVVYYAACSNCPVDTLRTGLEIVKVDLDSAVPVFTTLPGTDLSTGPDGKKPDPFCDTNANARWDGIYADNGRGPANGIHDPIEARAVARGLIHAAFTAPRGVTVLSSEDLEAAASDAADEQA